ncbi:MAG TPA: hypothetical protein VHE09_11140 [Rhizomicrobium sp.]|nr:hypothetical protein [Rhizomicrobium sp.]
MYQDVVRDPHSKYAYAFLIALMVVIVSLITVSRSKEFILRHSRGVVYFGIGLIALGFVLMVAIIVFGVEAQRQPVSMENWFYLAIGPMVVGSMVAMTPIMIHLNGPITELLRKFR